MQNKTRNIVDNQYYLQKTNESIGGLPELKHQ